MSYLNNNYRRSDEDDESDAAAEGHEDSDDNEDSEWGSSVATSDLDSTTDSECDWHEFENIPTYLPVLARFMAWH